MSEERRGDVPDGAGRDDAGSGRGTLGGAGLMVQDATIPFGAVPGLVHLSLSVESGERVALLGPSGAGKTSILRAAAGLQRMAAGCIRVGGRDVTAFPPEQRRVVYLHQTPALFPHLTALDNVGFPLEIRGVPRRDARARAAQLLEALQLGPLARRGAAALSGGQRHRVALARALAAEPAALLLDEPFADLDPTLRSEARAATLDILGAAGGIDRPAASSPSTVIVTHDVDEAAACADRILVLLGGRIAQDAAPATLLAHPASLAVARFLGIPNLVSGRSDGRGKFHSALGPLCTDAPAGVGVCTLRVDALRARRISPDRGQRESAAPATPGPVARVVTVTPQVAGTIVRVDLDGLALTAATDDSTLCSGDDVRIGVCAPRVHVVPADLAVGVPIAIGRPEGVARV